MSMERVSDEDLKKIVKFDTLGPKGKICESPESCSQCLKASMARELLARREADEQMLAALREVSEYWNRDQHIVDVSVAAIAAGEAVSHE